MDTQEFPHTEIPIHNLAMKDAVISFTDVEPVIQDSLHTKVLMMSGEVSLHFTDQVTHLVAGIVGSSKYQVATNLKKYVMLPEWVDCVWKAAQEGSVHCNDEQFQKYRCPVFKGLIITTKGLEFKDRKEVKKLVENEGGRYLQHLKVKKTSHLVVNEPKGRWFEWAKKWKIHTVTLQWVYDSIETGACLDENKYQVTDDASQSSFRQAKTSTPTKYTSAATESDIPPILYLTPFETHQNDTVVGSRNSCLFRGKTVVSYCLEEEVGAVDRMITENGGKFYRFRSEACDYAVVPLGGCQRSKLNAKEIVTTVWLESCLELNSIVPVNSNVLFEPMQINETAKPLINCVISFSGFCGVQKNDLMYLADLLGAKAQLFFVKNLTEAMFSNTHLVIQEAEGPKYAAAVEWKIHAVKKEWLFACAKSGKLEPEIIYICKPLTTHPILEVNTTLHNVNNSKKDVQDTANVFNSNETVQSLFVSPLNTGCADGKHISFTKKPSSVSDFKHNSSTVTKPNEQSNDAEVLSTELGYVTEEGNTSADSQKENRSATLMGQLTIGTPVQHSRIKELQNDKGSKLSPKQSNIQPYVDPDTPRKFLGHGKQYFPAFGDVQDVLLDFCLRNTSRRASFHSTLDTSPSRGASFDDLEALVRNSILCQHPDYNAAFLANDVVQPQEEYCPPEVVDLRARIDELEKKAKEDKQLRMSLKIKIKEMETRENKSKNLLQMAETRITSQNEHLTAEVAEQKKMLENVDKEMAELQDKVQQIQKQLEVMQKQPPSESR